MLAATSLLAGLGGLTTAVAGTSFGPLLRRMFVERIGWLFVVTALALGSWGLKAALV